jgi:hypothetical protein
VALSYLLGRVDALAIEGGRHADVGHQDVRRGRRRTGDGLVVVGRDADHREVRMPVDERAHALAHEEIVVG